MNQKKDRKKGGMQRKTFLFVLLLILATIGVFAAVSAYQNSSLVRIVQKTRDEQQKSISEISQETMQGILQSAFVNAVSLEAAIADHDFSEVVDHIRMLGSLTEGIFSQREKLGKAEFSLPDPALDGEASAMVLFEEGVDYENSELLATAAHLAGPMISMFANSDKIEGLFIGLADGTDLCVDDKSATKLDENGDPIPFPVRSRPWYRGAVEAGELYFTGLEEDAFTGKLLVTCALPVYGSGELIGVIGIDIRPEGMEGFITSAAESSGNMVFVLNQNGEVLLSSEMSGAFSVNETNAHTDIRTLGNEEVARFVDLALKEKTGLEIVTISGKPYYAVGAPMSTVGWTVISIVDQEITERPEMTMRAAQDKINEDASTEFQQKNVKITINAWILIAFLFLLMLVATAFGVGRIIKPINTMTESIIEGGKTGKLFEMQDCYRTHDEIEILAESFDDLSKKTKKYIEDITAITAEKERVRTELTMANEIQTNILPHIFPAFPARKEFDLFASMDPAKEVGGDFYDFFLIDEDHLGMVIADVSGKGVPAALFMMITKAILKNNALMGKPVGEILSMTNEMLCSNNKMQMFVTVWIGILTISTGRITAANAGHEYPAVMKDGRFELLKDRHGFVIGGMEGMHYKEYEILLQPGDKLFLYTDGVPEATNAEKELFGTERMLDALNESPDASAEDLLKNVRFRVDRFVQEAEQFDDLTMLCLEYKGPGALS